jgi:hypothetical protein
MNIARLVAPKGDPAVQDFFDQLDAINAQADASPGFVWRLIGEAGNATDVQPTIDPQLVVNMSVWENAEALFNYVYKSSHAPVMARRKEWFERPAGAYQVLWWVRASHRPSMDEGLARLWHLERFGPTALAFTFKARFASPAETSAPIDMKPAPGVSGTPERPA